MDCGNPSPQDQFADQPALVIEILSPSTEWFDETDTLQAYLAIPSMRHVVLLSQRRIFGRIWTRAMSGWTTQDASGAAGVLDLPNLDVRLSMANIYDGVALDATGDTIEKQ